MSERGFILGQFDLPDNGHGLHPGDEVTITLQAVVVTEDIDLVDVTGFGDIPPRISTGGRKFTFGIKRVASFAALDKE